MNSVTLKLRSVGDPELLSYQTKLMRIVATPSDIRNKYGDNISALSPVLTDANAHKCPKVLANSVFELPNAAELCIVVLTVCSRDPQFC